MRVIGGSARGRRLVAPAQKSVRPTADRVREAIFDVLEHLDVVIDATVLDCFAGSGALGIEALSRGARVVTFIEQQREVAKVITANLASTALGQGRSQVVCAEVLGYLARHRPSVDLAFADPPYDFGRWDELLSSLSAGVVVAESNRPISLTEGFSLHRVYRYGGTLVTVAMQKGRSDGEQQ